MNDDFLETNALGHASEEDLIMAYYDEAPSATLEHLASCEACREELEGLRRLLDRVRQVEDPDLDAAYGQRVWSAIESQLAGTDRARVERSGWLSTPPIGRLSWLAATLLLVVGAYVIGRTEGPTPADPRSQPVVIASDGTKAVLEVALAAHFESSALLLKEVSHVRVVDDGSVLAARADRLLAHNRLFRATPMTSENPALSRTLEEVERWLLDVAHLEPASSSLTAVRSRSRQNGLRLRLELMIQQLRQDDVRRPAPELEPGDNHVQSV